MAAALSSSFSLRRRALRLVVALALAVAGVAPGVPPLPARAEAPVAASDRVEVVGAKGTTVFTVELADTDASRAEGLMFRKEMAADHGMLFDFRREQPVWFWMKNTYLPLDMIFARADGVIVSIARDAVPLSEETIGSGGSVRFVLEVNAGTAERLGLKPGDRLMHPRIRAAR